MNLLKSYSAKVRKEAAIALGIVGKTEAYDPLLNALGDIDWDVRLCAAQSLSQLGHKEWLDIVKGDYSDYERLGASKNELAVIPLGYALRWADDHETLNLVQHAFKQLADDTKNEAAVAGMLSAMQQSMQNLMNFGNESF